MGGSHTQSGHTSRMGTQPPRNGAPHKPRILSCAEPPSVMSPTIGGYNVLLHVVACALFSGPFAVNVFCIVLALDVR